MPRVPAIAVFASGAVAFAALPATSAPTFENALPAPTASLFSWTPEQQIAAYGHIEKVWPTRVVRRGKSVYPLPIGKTQINPSFSYDGVFYTTQSYMEATRISGVLVLQHGKIIMERYGLHRTPQERWTSFSVTKSITSTLIGAAIKDGYIKSLDDPLARYVPELQGSVYETATIRQLLTMATGVAWNENYSDPNADAAKIGLKVLEPGVSSIVSYMRQLGRAGPAGEFNYNTGQTDLAGIVLSNAVGRPLSQYLSEKIWAPFGMEEDAVWPEDIDGHERGGCCLAMTLRDYGRFGLFILHGGKAAGRDVLPPGWVADATTTHVVARGYQPAPTGYGYFWWTRPMDAYEAVGVYGQSITVFPNDDLVIVVNAAWPAPTGLTQGRLAFMLAIRDAARMISGRRVTANERSS